MLQLAAHHTRRRRRRPRRRGAAPRRAGGRRQLLARPRHEVRRAADLRGRVAVRLRDDEHANSPSTTLNYVDTPLSGSARRGEARAGRAGCAYRSLGLRGARRARGEGAEVIDEVHRSSSDAIVPSSRSCAAPPRAVDDDGLHRGPRAHRPQFGAHDVPVLHGDAGARLGRPVDGPRAHRLLLLPPRRRRLRARRRRRLLYAAPRARTRRAGGRGGCRVARARADRPAAGRRANRGRGDRTEPPRRRRFPRRMPIVIPPVRKALGLSTSQLDGDTPE